MSSIPAFPSTNAIPPYSFYNILGLANWLNLNPSYKGYFINYPNDFPYLYSQSTINEFISTSQNPSTSVYIGYNIENVPLFSNVTTLSQQQSRQYTQQVELFRRVYAYNSNAYVNYVDNGVAPIYYRFQTYQELTQFKSAVSLVNKLYPFNAMAYGTNEYGSTLGWVIPFPL